MAFSPGAFQMVVYHTKTGGLEMKVIELNPGEWFVGLRPDDGERRTLLNWLTHYPQQAGGAAPGWWEDCLNDRMTEKVSHEFALGWWSQINAEDSK